ncbi:MAG TPA: hypothetical protein VL354_10735 [Spirochaetia bacterium]|nr:hypothetical protein [Spirochaetia bacterium]
MIAYVFWHWKKPDLSSAEYEESQCRFHASLKDFPPPGFVESFSVALEGASWAADGGPAYEDWYLVDDFAALGSLNEAAVSGTRREPHDVAAAGAAGGVAGIYALRSGAALVAPRRALWLSKPGGMTYGHLFSRLSPLVDREAGALWMRQMTLGPAKEFCLHCQESLHLPLQFEALPVELRQVWPRLDVRPGPWYSNERDVGGNRGD